MTKRIELALIMVELHRKTLHFALAASVLLPVCGCLGAFDKQPPRHNHVSGEKRSPLLNPGGRGYVDPDQEAIADAAAKSAMNQNPRMMQAPNPTPAASESFGAEPSPLAASAVPTNNMNVVTASNDGGMEPSPLYYYEQQNANMAEKPLAEDPPLMEEESTVQNLAAMNPEDPYQTMALTESGVEATDAALADVTYAEPSMPIEPVASSPLMRQKMSAAPQPRIEAYPSLNDVPNADAPLQEDYARIQGNADNFISNYQEPPVWEGDEAFIMPDGTSSIPAADLQALATQETPAPQYSALEPLPEDPMLSAPTADASLPWHSHEADAGYAVQTPMSAPAPESFDVYTPAASEPTVSASMASAPLETTTENAAYMQQPELYDSRTAPEVYNSTYSETMPYPTAEMNYQQQPLPSPLQQSAPPAYMQTAPTYNTASIDAGVVSNNAPIGYDETTIEDVMTANQPAQLTTYSASPEANQVVSVPQVPVVADTDADDETLYTSSGPITLRAPEPVSGRGRIIPESRYSNLRKRYSSGAR